MDIPTDKDSSVISINPGKYKLPQRGESVGYIIAEDKEVADEIRNCDKEREIKEEMMHNFGYEEGTMNGGLKRTNLGLGPDR
jgi:hypothetical protein